MTHEEQRLRRLRHERIARTKRLLRWMPRRTNVHRYPGLKWVAAAARRRHYLWSFRVRPAVWAIYAGTILSLLPIYGVQVPIALLLAFLLRANLPILVSLQFITNPLTALPIYYVAYHIGRLFLLFLGHHAPMLDRHELHVLIEGIKAGEWGANAAYVGTVWAITALGGLIVGTFVASIGGMLYRLAAHEVSVTFHRLKELQNQRQLHRADHSHPDNPPPPPPSQS